MTSADRGDRQPREPTQVSTRLVTLKDAAALARLAVVNREHLAPFSPVMEHDALTEAGQASRIASALDEHAHDRHVPLVIVLGEDILGRVSLNSLVRGAAHSASIGYWVSERWCGRGIASTAVARAVDQAFGAYGLHRIQAETLLDNVGSQKVLARNGFERIGQAPKFLRIAGRWQDHVLFQRVNDAWTPDQTGRPAAM